MQEKIKLSLEQLRSLKIITHYCLKTGKGCSPARTMAHHKTINDLVAMDLIFFNQKEGYFPTTKAQDLIKTFK